jgi:hypothetical protein
MEQMPRGWARWKRMREHPLWTMRWFIQVSCDDPHIQLRNAPVSLAHERAHLVIPFRQLPDDVSANIAGSTDDQNHLPPFPDRPG